MRRWWAKVFGEWDRNEVFLVRYCRIALLRLRFTFNRKKPDDDFDAFCLKQGVTNKRVESGIDVDWPDLFSIEQANISLLDESELDLPARQIEIRIKQLYEMPVDVTILFDSVIGEGQPQSTSKPQKHETVIALLQNFYLTYSTLRDKEYRRTFAIHKSSVLTAAVLVLGLTLMLVNYAGPQPTVSWLKFPTLGFVIWAGLMGGSISVILRLSALQTSAKDSSLLVQFDKAMNTIYTSALTGAAFAVVLYGIFCAQLVRGPVFPLMQTLTEGKVGTDYSDVSVTANQIDEMTRQFVWHLHPQGSRDFALVICWAFIAGFFERFVPDMLSKIAESQKKEAKSK